MSEKTKRREKYSLCDLLTAKTAVRSGEMTAYSAVKLFSIPKTTLYSNLQENTKSNKLGGRKLLSDDDEIDIVNWIISCAERGYPRTRTDVLGAAASLLRRKTGYKEAPAVGKDWYIAFRKRHPEISDRAVSVVSRASAVVSENNLRGWHREITIYFTQNDLLHILNNEPERIFNGDESGFQLVPDIKGKVLAKVGARNIFKIASGLEKVTAMYTICADGSLIPPMMLYKNNNKMKEIAKSMPSNRV